MTQTAATFELDPHRLQARGAQLLAGDVVYLPVRHHSPACARRVAQVIAARPPHTVLVEGPPSFDDQIDHLLHPDARLPLAVHAHVALDSGPRPGAGPHTLRLGAYYPLCDYSPELVALRAGARAGARLGFADLDYPELAAIGGMTPDGALVQDGPVTFSRALHRLAADLGCRDHDELWDQLFETSALDVEAFVAAVAAYGALARADPDPGAAVTGAREAAMARVIAAAAAGRATGDGPVVVVLGAYHVAAVPELVEDLLRGDGAAPEPGPVAVPVERGHALVRYSFDRLDALSGYASGMPSPDWYQRVWDEGDGAVWSCLAEIAERLRERGGDGQPATPTLSAALTQARLLAELRGRDQVGRTDVLDAVTGCFDAGLAGADRVLREVTAQVLTGHRVGVLPPGTHRPPLAVDVDRIATDLKLDLTDSRPRELTLELYRDPRHRRISRFLHGLRTLQVPLGTPLRQPGWGTGSRDLIRERWQVAVSLRVDVALAEASRWGQSLAEALRNHFQHALAALADGSSRELVRLLLRAAQCGAHDAAAGVLGRLRSTVATEADLREAVAALADLDLLWVAREPLGATALTGLPELAGQLYLSAVRLVAGTGGCADRDAAAFGTALTTLAGLVRTSPLLTGPTGADPHLFWAALGGTGGRDSHPLLRGTVAGLRWQARLLGPEALVVQLTGELAGPDADAFLTGLLAAARELLWAEPELLTALSDALVAWDEEDFVHRLPGLRSAFTALSPRETDRVARELAATLGQRVDARVFDLAADQLTANLAASVQVRRRLAADGLAGWLE